MKKKALAAFLLAIAMGMSIQMPAVGIATTCLAAELDDGCDGVPVTECRPSMSTKPAEEDGCDGEKVEGSMPSMSTKPAEDDGCDGEEAEESKPSISAPTQKASYQITASSLNVRSGAGTSFSRIGSLSKGTKVDVLEVKDNWGKINYNGKEGWISMDYCKMIAADDTQQKISYKVTASTLNVRSGAGTGYSKIGSLTRGTTVEVLEIRNDWAKISYKTQNGWISLAYCRKCDSDSASSVSGAVYKVIASALNVRSGAGTNYSRIGSIARGALVSVYDIKNGWGKIQYKNEEGWVSLNYCKKQ